MPSVQRCDQCSFESSTLEGLKEHIETHKTMIYKCNYCEVTANSEEELKAHIASNHQSSTSNPSSCQNKCKEYETLEASHTLLKENYERLIEINKKFQTVSKDKEVALDIQLEDLRRGYEKTK